MALRAAWGVKATGRIVSAVTNYGESAAPAAGRQAELPCQWCGRPVVQPDSGRRRKYCRRSCRQRAYEHRQWAKQIGIPEGSLVLTETEAESLSERVYLLRCAAEDLQTAVAEGASGDELTGLAADLVAAAREAEHLR